jgi:hypothetical protein
MTLDQLSYLQRETLKGLCALGGVARRSEIARAANIDGLKVPAALTRLESFGYADKGEDQRWRLSDNGKLILQTANVNLPDLTTEPEPELEPPPSPPPSPIKQKPMRERMQDELKARPAPTFDPADAAWLCRALAEEHRDMPTIATMLNQIAQYFRGYE